MCCEDFPGDNEAVAGFGEKVRDLCDDGILVDAVLEAAVVNCELDVLDLDKVALVPVCSHPLVR